MLQYPWSSANPFSLTPSVKLRRPLERLRLCRGICVQVDRPLDADDEVVSPHGEGGVRIRGGGAAVGLVDCEVSCRGGWVRGEDGGYLR